MMSLLLSIYVWFVYIILYIVLLIPTCVLYVLSFPFGKHHFVANYMFMLVGRSILWLYPFWKVNIKGLDNYDSNSTCVFIANHQSFMDMPLLATLPWRMKWVSKDALFKVPVLGQYMSLAGHISVKRGTVQALKSLNKLHPYLNSGVSVMLFPEGTRSRKGELLKFKNGAFMLANEMNVPIQPILISGTRDIIKPDTFLAALNGTMTASIMKKFHPKDFTSVEEFRDEVYFSMHAELSALTKLSLQD
jgi:1-acyl-sn-glycerol-3-phosphate acyltransferase